MGIYTASIEVEDFLNELEGKGWKTQGQKDFFRALFEYVDGLEEGQDPDDLESDLMSMTTYNANNPKEFKDALIRVEEMLKNPNYKVPEEIKEGFAIGILDPNYNRHGKKKGENIEDGDEIGAEEKHVDEKLEDENLVNEIQNKGPSAEQIRRERIKRDNSIDRELEEDIIKNINSYKAKYAEDDKKVEDERNALRAGEERELYDKARNKRRGDFKLGQQSLFTKNYTMGEFIEKARENGWNKEDDLNAFKILYKVAENAYYGDLSDILETIATKDKGLNENERMRVISSIDDLARNLYDRRVISSTIRYKITDKLIFWPQNEIDDAYREVFNKDRPKTLEEKNIEEKRKDLKPGELYIYDFTEEEFLKKAAENGWATDVDQDVLASLYNYREKNGYKNSDHIDSVLNSILNKNAWFVADREELIKEMQNGIKAEGKTFLSPLDRNYEKVLTKNIGMLGVMIQEELDAEYEKKFGKKRQKSDREIEYERKEQQRKERERKRQEEERLKEIKQQNEEKYRKESKVNRKAFDDYFKLTRFSFTKKCAENGWVYNNDLHNANDEKGLGKLYEAARNSGNKKLIGLLDKLLIREVETIEKREAVIKEINETVKEVLKDESIYEKDRNLLNDVIKGEVIRADIPKGEFKFTMEKLNEKQKKYETQENKRTFRDILYNNGWNKYDTNLNRLFNAIYDAHSNLVKNGVSPLDSAVEKLMNSKVDGKYQYRDEQRILNTLLEDAEKSKVPSYTLADLQHEVNRFRDKTFLDNAAKDEKRYKFDQKLSKFNDRMKKLGWPEDSLNELKPVFETYYHTLIDGKSSLDPFMSVLVNSKIDPKNVASSVNQVVRQFKDMAQDSKRLYEGHKEILLKAANVIILKNKKFEDAEIEKKNAADLEVLKKSKQEGEKLFAETMLLNGWDQNDLESLKSIFNTCYDTTKGFEDREGAINILKDTKASEKNPYSSKLEILRDFQKYLLNDADKKNVKDDIEKLTGKYKKLEEEYRKKQFDEIKAEIRENKPAKENAKSNPRKDDADVVKDSQKKAKAKLDDPTEANNNLIERLRREATEMYNTIKAVDFNLLGKGSPEFTDMLRDLKDLKEYAERELYVDNKGLIHEAVLAEYYDKQKECLDSVNKYVEHKREDLRTAGRKESWWRSRHEQPRISASLSVLEKLGASYEKGRAAIIENARELHRNELSTLLAKQEESLKDADVKGLDYEITVGTAAEMIGNLNGRVWKPAKGESLVDFVKRAEKLGQSATYLNALNDIYVTGHVARNVYEKVEKISTDEKYEGKQYPAKKPLNVNQLTEIFKEVNPDEKYINKPQIIDVSERVTKVKDSVKTLKDQMLSEKQKKADAKKVKPHEDIKKGPVIG